MKVIFISDNGLHHKKMALNIWLLISLPLMLLVSIWFFSHYFHLSLPKALISSSDENAYKAFSEVLNKLSLLESEVQRLNSLSDHIAVRSKIDINNFDLSHAPALGGAVKSKYLGSSIVRGKEISRSVELIDNSIKQQKLKLKHLLLSLDIKEAEESLMVLTNGTSSVNKNKKEGLDYEFSAPLEQGYISSPFGSRRDPINGSLRHHGGVDIAVKKGSNIYAIANGFISFSGKRGAYGNLLEINHSELLKSRYAHLDIILVKKGQLVRKGDLIGKVGDTGRVTGPHLHLEIRENNKLIDPKIYLKSVLRNL